MTEAVVAAATELTAILATKDVVDKETAQSVTNFVSSLIESETIGGRDDEVSEESGKQITASIFQLARAVTADPTVGEVRLTSPKLNLTTEARPALELTAKRVRCETTSAAPTEVSMPSDLLSSVPGIDTSLPVSVVLFASAVNLHRGLEQNNQQQAGNQATAATGRRRMTASTAGGSAIDADAGAGVGNVTAAVHNSPMVSFSLMQSGSELRVQNAASRINVSIPFDRLDAEVPTCVGQPVNGTSYDPGCAVAIECKWWSESGNGSWSSEGCMTVPSADGSSFVCSCDHLTDFIIFEFPTTTEELLEDVLQALAVNGLALTSFQCLASPSYSDVPVLWTIEIVLLLCLLLGVSNAVRRDRRELRNVELLLKGKRADARKRVANLVLQAAKEERRRKAAEEGQATGKLRRGSRVRSRAASVFTSSRRRASTVGVVPALKHAASTPANNQGEDNKTRGGGRRRRSSSIFGTSLSLVRGFKAPEGSAKPRTSSIAASAEASTAATPAAPAAASDVGVGSSRGLEARSHLRKDRDDFRRNLQTRQQQQQQQQQEGTGSASATVGSGPAAVQGEAALVRGQRSPRPCCSMLGPATVQDITSIAGSSSAASAAEEESSSQSYVQSKVPLMKTKRVASSSHEASESGATSSLASSLEASSNKASSDMLHGCTHLQTRLSRAVTPSGGAELPASSACLAIEGGGLARVLQQGRRASRVEADVLGIFGTNRATTNALVGHRKSAEGTSSSAMGDATSDAAVAAPKPSAAIRWRQARLIAQQEVFVKRWHKDVDKNYKRLWLGFKDSHTLMAGLMYRGAGGYTRAQTVMVLLNSLALEIVILCMFYSAPSSGPMVVNPVKIVVNGALCACICIPVMVVFVLLFEPMQLLRMGIWLVRTLVCWPSALHQSCRVGRARAALKAIAKASRSCVGRVCRCRGTSSAAKVMPAIPPPAPVVIGAPIGGLCQGTTTSALAPHNLPANGITTVTTVTTTTVTTTTVVPADEPTPPPSPPTPCEASSNVAPQRLRRVSLPMASIAASRRCRSVATELPGSSEGGSGGLRALQRRGSSLQSRLKRAVSRLGTASEGAGGRTFSYASLNEHLLVQSLTKSWARKDWKAVARILFGWTTNLLLFFGMCLVFALYACEIYLITSAADVTSRELILSWAFSIFQRFIVNEPALILAGKGLPMLFSSAFCANVCGESIANMLGLLVEGFVACLKEIRSGG